MFSLHYRPKLSDGSLHFEDSLEALPADLSHTGEVIGLALIKLEKSSTGHTQSINNSCAANTSFVKC